MYSIAASVSHTNVVYTILYLNRRNVKYVTLVHVYIHTYVHTYTSYEHSYYM